MKGAIRTIVALAVSSASLILTLGGGAFAGVGAAGAAAGTCDASALTLKLGRTSGAAGTTWYTLEFVNHSKKSCSLSGTPIARPGFMTYGMTPWEDVGPRSIRDKFARRGGTVVIAPVETASVDLGVGTAANYRKSTCAPQSILGVQLTFVTPARPARFDFTLPKTAVCTKLASTSITGIALGTHFP
jgi:hypothetical protein